MRKFTSLNQMGLSHRTGEPLPKCMIEDVTRAVVDCDSAVFQECIGGDIYLVTEPKDLFAIDTGIEKNGSEWYSIAEKSDAFDICNWLGDEEVVVVCMMWNDAGGNVYYIPKEFVTQNVLDSIKKTTQAWED